MWETLDKKIAWMAKNRPVVELRAVEAEEVLGWKDKADALDLIIEKFRSVRWAANGPTTFFFWLDDKLKALEEK